MLKRIADQVCAVFVPKMRISFVEVNPSQVGFLIIVCLRHSSATNKLFAELAN